MSDQYGGATTPAPKKVTVPDLVAMKRDGRNYSFIKLTKGAATKAHQYRRRNPRFFGGCRGGRLRLLGALSGAVLTAKPGRFYPGGPHLIPGRRGFSVRGFCSQVRYPAWRATKASVRWFQEQSRHTSTT